MCVTNTAHRRSQGISLTVEAINNEPTTSPQPCKLLSSAQLRWSNNGRELLHTGAATGDVNKPCPKRRRKPQKPGFTAKHNERHFVVHNYHDHAHDDDDELDLSEHHDNITSRRTGKVSFSFPLKLHKVLEQVEADGLSNVISWQPHGRAFVIHMPKEFVEHVMPMYFRQSKLTSFQRQLNLYGFQRLTKGADAGGYYHELMLRGKPGLCQRMVRTKVKGTKFKAASSPDQEPDFYAMPPVTMVSNNMVSDESDNMSFCSGGQDSSFTPTPPQEPQHAVAVAATTPASMPQLLPLATLSFNLEQLPGEYGIQQQGAAAGAAPAAAAPAQTEVDCILNEAVDELFMVDGSNNELSETLNDFVHDWDPSFDEMDETLDEDYYLGRMLDRMLAE